MQCHRGTQVEMITFSSEHFHFSYRNHKKLLGHCTGLYFRKLTRYVYVFFFHFMPILYHLQWSHESCNHVQLDRNQLWFKLIKTWNIYVYYSIYNKPGGFHAYKGHIFMKKHKIIDLICIQICTSLIKYMSMIVFFQKK